MKRKRLLTLGVVIAVLALAATFLAVPAVRTGLIRALRQALNLEETASEATVVYTCPMHPQIKLPQMGDCPICGMSLVRREAGAAGATGTVSLTPRQIQLAGVRSEKVIERPLVSVIDTVGRIDYDERRLAKVTAWVEGRIDRLEVNFTGVTIDKGHPLVDLYSPPLISAQQEYIEALQAYETVKDSPIRETRNRARDLIRSTRQRLLWWGLTESQVDEIAKTRKVRSHITIFAPIGGTVIHKHVVEGQYVKTGDTLFEIADLSRVWMYADIYESELPSLLRPRQGDFYECPMHPEVRGGPADRCPTCGMPLLRRSPKIQLSITSRSYPGQVFTGTVEFTDPFVNPRTRTLRIRCTIENPDLQLRPEMYVRARILLHEGRLPALPESAVIHSGKRRIVLIDEGGGTFRPVLVRLGRMWLHEEGHVPTEEQALPFHRGLRRYHEVLAGVKPGDRVVTSGNFLLNSESQIQGALEHLIGPEEEEKAPEAKGPFHEAMRRVIQEYLRIHAALAADSIKTLGPATAILERIQAASAAAATGEDRSFAESLVNPAKRLAAETDARKIREAFGDLSDALLRYWRSSGSHPGMDVHVAYCPMVKRHWLQEGRSIRNPYDPSMPGCGVIQE